MVRKQHCWLLMLFSYLFICTFTEVLSIMTKKAICERALLKLINSAWAMLFILISIWNTVSLHSSENPGQSVNEFESAVSSLRLSFLEWICLARCYLNSCVFCKVQVKMLCSLRSEQLRKDSRCSSSRVGSSEGARVWSRSCCWFQNQ